MVDTFQQSNLQNTDIISLQSRIISLKKLITLYEDDVEYRQLLALYENYISLKNDNPRLISAFDKKLKRVNRSVNSKLPTQESPIITIGTMLRILSVDEYLDKIMDKYDHKNIQVISLGSGSDLRFQLDKYKDLYQILEVDFKDALDLKQRSVSKLSGNVKFINMDISNLAECKTALLKYLDPTKETIIIMECLLCYLTIPVSINYFNFFKSVIPLERLHYLVYDPVSLSENDPFSNVMFDNLKKHNSLDMFSLKEYKTIDKYINRFQMEGKLSYTTLWDYLKTRNDMKELCKLCQIDEFEELEILLSHYIIAYS